MTAAPDMSDHELMRRFRDGDGTAFEVIVRRWEQPVARVLSRLAANNGDVDDLCQEVFLRVLRAHRRYRAAAAFSTWLYRITLNVARDHLRRRRSRSRWRQQQPESGPAAPTDAPGELLNRRELAASVQAALGALPRNMREVLALRHFGGLTFDQVARTTGLPITTVKSRAYAALKRLRSELKKCGVTERDLES